MVSCNIDSLLRSITEQAAPTHILGTTASTRALIVARYSLVRTQQTEKQGPLVVLCPNDDIASEFCADLECLATTVEGKSLNVYHFPTWEQSPYSPISLSLQTRLARIKVLSALAKNEFPHIIITTPAASSQATLTKNYFLQSSLLIQIEQSLGSRETFITRLLESGYLRVDPVEDPGTFAVRGEIIDIFPPDQVRPIRIELFGDTVERIRSFDPSTQRAVAHEQALYLKVFIPPAREVLINKTTSCILRERIKSRADDMGISRAIRDPLLASVRDGIYPSHSDSWAPFVYDKPAHFWHYLPVDYRTIWNDAFSCQQEWDRFQEEQNKRSAEAAQSEVIAPTIEALFHWSPSLKKTIQDHSHIFMDRMELASATSDDSPNSHRVSIHPNTHLSHGSRHSLGELEPEFRVWIKQGFRVLILASTQSQLERIRFLLEGRGLSCKQEGLLQPSNITLSIGSLSEGFRWADEGLVILTEGEILGAKHLRKQRKVSTLESGSAAKDWSGLQALSDLEIGDAIVHVDHGIGRYQGIIRLDLSGALSDFLSLEYANKDKLYLPVYRLNVIQKYIGMGDSIALDRLGSQQFAKTKEKVRESVKRLAFDLVQLYAKRKISTGIQFSPRDADFREFEAKFPFDETPDQLKAIDAALADMEAGRVMDRLICGDVGYGKTEVAIRAAFRAVSDGKQVAVLVPTTILAQQHEQSFKSRLKDYPLIIETISRFKTPKNQKSLLEAVKKGRVDIIIGTHRLLSKDVIFHDLGLIIVDEEHRFGVEHKERLKTLRTNTHVLTLTATPIPRTLHMALSGLRDISLINTPPIDRLPIRTYISQYDDAVIKRAIEFELSRGGQVFFLHNKVHSIYKTASRVQELVPAAQILVAHGQMPERELETAMDSFYHKKSNVLICTTIIESGIDLPSANTIIIDRADTLGLAQLYQIRGRVGRSQQRAYAYLLIPHEKRITEDAKRRLEVIQKFVELGSGFSIASHDLEIRGGGDILGPQQSGSIAAVGFDLYTEILEEAIQELQGQDSATLESSREPEIKIPFPSFLAEAYVPDVHQRLSLYRRFSAASQETEIDHLEEEMRDRFGNPPIEAQNLLWLIRIKILLKKCRIDALTVGPEKVSLLPGPHSLLNPIRTIALLSAYPDRYQLKPDSKLIAKIATTSPRDLFFGLESLFKEFS